MKTIYKFIIKQWVSIFLSTFLILILITILGDFIDHIMKHELTIRGVLSNLYVKSTIIVAKILPIACIMSSLFFLNKLKTHSELTAILASGFGKRKIANILLFGGLFTGAVQFLNTGFHEAYVFDFNQGLEKSLSSKFSKKVATDSGIWFKNDLYYGSFFYFDQEQKKIIKPKIFFYKNHLVNKVVEAKYAVLKDNNLWNFHDVQMRSQLDNDSDFPVLESHKVLTQELKENFTDLNKYQSGVQSLTIFKLKSFIDNLKKYKLNVTEYLMMFYDKLATALSCLIFTVFPIFTLHNIGKRSSSAGRSVFFTLLFTLCFWFIAGSTQTLGLKLGITPFLSVFTTHLVLCVFCLYHYLKLEKLV